jgi:CheY-like chemotaxis protein
MIHIAVVEDDAHNAVLFRRLLEKRGPFRVTVTESAEELFRLVRDGEVSLVIMDVSLANTTWGGKRVSGVELCRLLKAGAGVSHVPVMLATAHAMRGDDTRLLAESGADAYVSKPIVDHEAFVNRVRELARREAA